MIRFIYTRLFRVTLVIVALIALFFVLLSQTESNYTRFVLVPATTENIETSLLQANSDDWINIIIVCNAAGEETRFVDQINLKSGELCGIGHQKDSEWDIKMQTSSRELCVSVGEFALISHQEKYRSLATPEGYPTCSEDLS